LIPVIVRLCRAVDGVASVSEDITFRADGGRGGPTAP
jgi:hypothetical protein